LLIIGGLLLFSLITSIFDRHENVSKKDRMISMGVIFGIALACLGLKQFVVDNYAEIDDSDYRTVYHNVKIQNNADLSKFVQTTLSDNKISKNEYSAIKKLIRSSDVEFKYLDSDAKLDLGGFEVTPIKLEGMGSSAIYLSEGLGKSVLYMGFIIAVFFFVLAGIRYKKSTKLKDEESKQFLETAPAQTEAGAESKPYVVFLVIGSFLVLASIGGIYHSKVSGNVYANEVEKFFEANKGNAVIEDLKTQINEGENISSADILELLEAPAKIEKNTIIEKLKNPS
jgi:hypothetical protein